MKNSSNIYEKRISSICQPIILCCLSLILIMNKIIDTLQQNYSKFLFRDVKLFNCGLIAVLMSLMISLIIQWLLRKSFHEGGNFKCGNSKSHTSLRMYRTGRCLNSLAAETLDHSDFLLWNPIADNALWSPLSQWQLMNRFTLRSQFSRDQMV